MIHENIAARLQAALGDATEATRWGRALDLIERCEDDDALAQTVRALKMQASRWQPGPMSRWAPDGDWKEPVATGSEWHRAIPLGILQVAPIRWIELMAAGARSPKYGLARAIHTHGLELDSTQWVAMLSCPDLTDLRQLDMHTNGLGASFFEALRTLPSTRTLERLRLSNIVDYNVGGIEGDHHLGALSTLSVVREAGSPQSGALSRFLRAPAIRRIDELHLERDDQDTMLELLDDPGVLPHLRTLGVRTHVPAGVRAALGRPAFRRVERACVALTLEVHRSGSPEELARGFATKLNHMTRGVRGIRHLDLTHTKPVFYGYTGRSIVDHFPQAMMGALADWETPEDLEVVTLGPWWSETIEEWLAHDRGVRALQSAEEAY